MMKLKSPLARQHTLLHNCDNLVNIAVSNGAAAVDNARFVEGLGSIRFTNNPGVTLSTLFITLPAALYDFSIESIMRCKIRLEDADNSIYLTIREVDGDLFRWPIFTELVTGVFVEVRQNLSEGGTAFPGNIHPTIDLVNIESLRFWFNTPDMAAHSFNVDWVEKIFPTQIPDYIRLLPWWQ